MDKKLAVVGGGMLVLGLVFGFMIEDISHGHGYERHEYGDKEAKEYNMMGNMHDMHDDYKKTSTSSMAGMMHDMNRALEGKTGAEFDAAFLREMIVHHEGAVEMAKAARERAADPRIKALAEAIITAQEKEIADMKAWQTTPATPAAQ